MLVGQWHLSNGYCLFVALRHRACRKVLPFTAGYGRVLCASDGLTLCFGLPQDNKVKKPGPIQPVLRPASEFATGPGSMTCSLGLASSWVNLERQDLGVAKRNAGGEEHSPDLPSLHGLQPTKQQSCCATADYLNTDQTVRQRPTPVLEHQTQHLRPVSDTGYGLDEKVRPADGDAVSQRSPTGQEDIRVERDEVWLGRIVRNGMLVRQKVSADEVDALAFVVLRQPLNGASGILSAADRLSIGGG
jgi:hypothetical protein